MIDIIMSNSDFKIIRPENKVRAIYFRDKFIGAIESTTASDNVLRKFMTEYESLQQELYEARQQILKLLVK